MYAKSLQQAFTSARASIGRAARDRKRTERSPPTARAHAAKRNFF